MTEAFVDDTATVRHPTARSVRYHEVLDAAVEVFGTYGYTDAKVEAITKRAGISKPILYDYFSGKLDLYLAVLRRYLDELVEGHRQALATPGSRQRVRATVQAYFDFIDRAPVGFRLIFDSEVTSEPSIRWHIDMAVRTCIQELVGCVTAETGMDPDRARCAATGLVGIAQFGARHWLATGRAVPKQDAIDTTFALCWGGLASIPFEPQD
ncbi:TetR/AcrR family transcriptional regulator [Nocardia stercoris]|uniref:TetR/AcrR family transcriptional regulator n=1 Tax=Nocardia stercoris TaxID=2483361 RepID=A0A3M2L339_9NOCA|nr:TetR/AcrR family transcriptional regulator [Nocardia stercoris]RMI31396.1 TetR/AcrR family transcriptional regulator [Nocardia stercoris]